ncbi:MAG: hypothetical protein QOH17_860 [Pseudonocardiales bacterium]|nr:hypothetical protein [Pseudonocardiales bacterium]
MGDKPRDDAVFGGRPVVAFHRDVDRRNFLKWAGMVGVGAAFVVGAGATPAFASTPAHAIPGQAASDSGDLGILNYALTLEYLEAEFYKQGLAANLVSGREMELISPIEAHEQAHVDAITATVKKLGGTPVAMPSIKFPDGTFGNRDNFLKTASTFEELGVSAYHGQVPLIMSADVLGAAASIAGVESRHAVILAQLSNGQWLPNAFETPKPMSDVLTAVKPYIS